MICFPVFLNATGCAKALNIPGPYSEAEVIQYFKARAAENSLGYTSFPRRWSLQSPALGHQRTPLFSAANS